MRSVRRSCSGESRDRSPTESGPKTPGRRPRLIAGEGVNRFQLSSLLASWEGGLDWEDACCGNGYLVASAYDEACFGRACRCKLEDRGGIGGEARGRDVEPGDIEPVIAREDRLGGGGSD